MWSIRMRTSQFARPRRYKQSSNERQKLLEKMFQAPTQSSPFASTSLLKHVYWAMRRFQFWLCYSQSDLDIDVDDLLEIPFNMHPPSLYELQRRTGFNRDWLMFIYRNFKQNSTCGRMTLPQWRTIFLSLFPYSIDYSYADRLFNVISTSSSGDSNGFITYQDLIMRLYELNSNKQQDRIPMRSSSTTTTDSSSTADFIFSLMAPDNCGRVDRAQFGAYARAIFALNVVSRDDFGISNRRRYVNVDELRCAIDEQFAILDCDHDGYICVDDVHRFIAESSSPIVL